MIARNLAIALALVAALSTGCEQRGEKPGTTEETRAQDLLGRGEIPQKAEKALQISNAVETGGRNFDEVLRQNDLSRDDFDELMYDVAKDPDLSKAYIENRGKTPSRTP